ncbi:uncharacterized protein G6M90_00g070690 [Metarhizium brunneum]|uniref:Uncharacterized protein n=1 Tax=Metarhizium brunneum TaxID=500148 RepID=A0A7D5Z2N4_9HYPO|nr:hypothetical protein G6M90_00g070690 [Metarhizium brunneum]
MSQLSATVASLPCKWPASVGSTTKHEFDDTKAYSVTLEVSPDGSRRRVGVVVDRYDKNQHIMSALLWVECKRPGGSLREVEKQALDADNLSFPYTMTTVGVSFRMPFYQRGGRHLTPFHGEATSADRTQYVDADSQNAIYIRDTKTTQTLYQIQ